MTEGQWAREFAIAAVEREMAEAKAALAAPDYSVRDTARPGSTGASIVFTLRLGHPEIAALRRRAAYQQLPPSVLARNLIRVGLSRETVSSQVGFDDEIGSLVRQLGALVTRLDEAMACH